MKKITIFCLVLVLTCILTLPVMAASDTVDYNGHLLADIRALPNYQTHRYAVVRSWIYDGKQVYGLTLSTVPFALDDRGGLGFWNDDSMFVYSYSSGWVSPTEIKTYQQVSDVSTIVWSNFPLYNDLTNELIYYGTGAISECDGSSCPANDMDFNNVCDDCGSVLTMSLRSTLFDYAQHIGTSLTAYPYYAIVRHPEADHYYVYLSADPMKADNDNVVTGRNMLQNVVYTDTDGTHKEKGNYSSESWTGELVFANHDIENFRMPPLAEIVQKVTEEVLHQTTPGVARTMMIILLCGVGCLALLLVLTVLVKVFKTFLPG